MDEIEKARKAMVRALKKYGANSAEFDKARNKWQSLVNKGE